MKLDFEFACDQLNSTNHSLLLELSLSASCQHILTMCIRSCTFMDTLPLSGKAMNSYLNVTFLCAFLFSMNLELLDEKLSDITRFRTIKLSDKILSENLMVRKFST